MWQTDGRTLPTASSQDMAAFAAISNSQASPFCCVKCQYPELEEAANEFKCSSCGSVFPIVHGVPLLVDNFEISDSDYQLNDEVADQICSLMGIVPSPESKAHLRSILGKKYRIGSLAQSAENNYFLNRVVVSEAEKRKSAIASASATPVNEKVHYSIDLHYIPSVLPANQRVSYNVRFTNSGNSTISSRGETPVMLSYQFITADGRVLEGRRTKLPIDVLPGCSLSVPMVIEAPRKAGNYQLIVQFVHERVAWLSEDGLPLSVEVTSKKIPEPWTKWHVTNVNHGGYDQDHLAAKKILEDQIRLQSNPRVLEIGGCCNPMMRGVCPDLHSIDIDMQTLQVGHLIAQLAETQVRYICADGNSLPYRENSFDWIVMFSTLHHFANPSAVLANLKRFLKPNGRIATMCEPIGHYIDGVVYDAFIEELEQGINEQTFTLEEYQMMIQNAGLTVDKAIVDVGSLKLILKA